MKIPKDHLQHAGLCAAAAVFIVALVWVAQRLGPYVAGGIGGTALAIAYEMLQKYRGEGVPSVNDAVAGAIGAWALMAVLWAGGHFLPI